MWLSVFVLHSCFLNCTSKAPISNVCLCTKSYNLFTGKVTSHFLEEEGMRRKKLKNRRGLQKYTFGKWQMPLLFTRLYRKEPEFLDVLWKVYLASITVWQPLLSDHRLHTPSSLTNVGENGGEREHLAPLFLVSTQRWCFTLPSKNLCSTYSHTEVISCGLL